MKLKKLFKNKYLMIFLLLAACGEKTQPPAAVPLVVTQKAQVGDATLHASFAGEVRARSESALGFRVGGKITQRLVDVGTRVKPGTPIARIDARDFQLNSAAATSQMAAAQADVTQAQADYARYNDLFQKKFVSAAEMDRRKATLDVAVARLAQAKTQLNVADNQGTYTALVADRAGVITSVDADVGQVVAAGQTVVRVAQDDEKEALITVPENRLPEVKAANRIEVSLWAAPDKRYLGKVREISPIADAVTRTYAVRVTMSDADDAVRLGMTASVLLLQQGAGSAVVLPLTALFQQGANTALWVVDSRTQTVSLVPVKVGVFREDVVTVVSGIQAGAVVVTAGVHKLTAGQKVRVASESATRK